MTLAAIVLGTVGLLLSGGFVHDIFAQLAEALIHSHSGHLQIAKRGFFTYGSRKPEEFVIPDPRRIRDVVVPMPETGEVMGRVHFSGLLNNGRTDFAIVGEGVEADAEARLGTSFVMSAGRQLTDRDEHGIVVGHGVAEGLGLAVGDVVTLVVTTAGGAMNTLDFDVVGTFQTFSKDYDARAVRINLSAAHKLLDNPGVNVLVVALKRTTDTRRVAEQVQRKLAEAGLETKRWDELNDFYAKAVDLYDRQFGILRLIILAMVLLSVMNTVNMTVFERTGEFGTMRALGNRSRTIFTLIVAENALLGLAGAVLGIGLGAALAWIISAIGIPMPPPPNADLGYTARIPLVPSVVLGAFIVAVVATTLAAIPPALRTVRIGVVDALRQNV